MVYFMNGLVLLLFVTCQSVSTDTKITQKGKNQDVRPPTEFKQEIIEYKGVDYIIGIVDLRTTNLRTFYKEDNGALYQNFEAIAEDQKTEGNELIFAMNGGIFNKDRSPTGLYIEDGKEITPINTNKGKGNFFLEPNGILTITKDNNATITNTPKYKQLTNTRTAIQSGPQLLTTGNIHPKFNENSTNTHIRNGVGVIDQNTLVFAMSRKKVNLFTFASFFKDKFECQDALYLDGFVSKVYSPELELTDMESDFSVIIGVVQ